MTLTLFGLAPAPATTPEPLEAPRTADGPALLGLLRDMVTAGIDVDPDLLHSTRPAGQAVLTVVAAARACAERLGEDAGTALTEAPGIVVLRDLAHALTLLERRIAPSAVPVGPTARLPREVADAHATFLRTVGQQG